MINKILDKKFKKSMFSGYDPIDVDSFFDETTVYIKETLANVDQVNLINKQLISTNADLTKKLVDAQNIIAELKIEINDYLKEGYGQNHINNKLNDLTKQVQDLKSKKQ